MGSHRAIKMGTSSSVISSIRKFGLEILFEVVSLMLTDIILPGFVVDNQIDEHRMNLHL